MELQLLLTGNEIMSGDTVDSNSSMIAQRIAREGYWVDRKVTVGDDLEQLVAEIRQISDSADILIINGGLGPTVDDLTAAALAQAAGVELEENADAAQHVTSWCAARGFHANAANMKQAILPTGVKLLENSVGSAVGFSLTLNRCLIMCTPGVPSELRAMLENAVLPMLRASHPQPDKPEILRYQTFGLGESGAQQMLDDAFPDWPEDIEVGFRAGAPMLEMKLRISSSCTADKRALWQDRFLSVLGDYVVGRDDTRLPEAIVELLAQRGQTVALAESCTGGLIASMLTAIPGSSAVFEMGLVSYSNAIKHSQLGVQLTTLDAQGAVSEACVLEMANGVCQQASSDYAIAVSGIAGPDGGTDEKPVGTVWVAWGPKNAIRAKQFHYPLGRHLFQTMISALALDLLRRDLLGLTQEPAYFGRFRPR